MSRVRKHKVKKTAVRQLKKSRISKKMIWTIIIGGLMIASVFGIMFSSYNSAQEETTFGDYTFQRTKTGWATEVNGKMAEFMYLPSDVEDFNISSEVVDAVSDAKVVYITFDPNSKNVQKLELMRFQLGNNLIGLFDKYAMPGVTEEDEAYSTQPLVDCLNSTMALPVIKLVEANQTTAYVKDSCVVLEVTEFSALALQDRLVFGMLGMI